MSLRNKILSGFIILVLMLSIAGIWSIYHFQHIGSRVNKMIDSEYNSINSAIDMENALEREDSAILLALLGNLYESSAILNSADSLFEYGLNQAKKSLNTANDNNLILEIENNYNVYKNGWQNITNSETQEDLLEWYFENTHLEFLNVQQ